ncbi:uncharacterized protein JCM15063_004133 [Sporobolomyces koalae]|uniref:uncharacterized protein n=1 Tax=Sporobolomyces koalae TaxID=500713 RepID=UPI00317E57AE
MSPPSSRRPSLDPFANSFGERRDSSYSLAPSSRRSSFVGAGRRRSLYEPSLSGRSLSGGPELAEDLAIVAQTHKRQFLMAEHIYRLCEAAGWFPDRDWGNIVAVRTVVATAGGSSYASYPPAYEIEGGNQLLDGLAFINAEAAVIVSSHVVRAILSQLPHAQELVTLTDNCAIQVIDSIDDLKSAKRHQYAAFVRDSMAMVLWSDEVSKLVPHAQNIADLMLEYIWKQQDDDAGSLDEKDEKFVTQVVETDLEAAEVGEKRPIGLLSPLHVGLALGINILVNMNTLRTLLREWYIDGYWPRLLIALAIPFQFAVSQFFCVIVVAVILQLLGPVKQMHENNRYYSGKRPPRMPGPLPDFTILMPVYKESLELVLTPTLRSLQAAIKTYELQGGNCNICVCDDGMQLLNKTDYATRKAFYEANAIGYVARPKHGKYYHRAGRFKKSSNLNVALELSIKIEHMMNERRPERAFDNPWTFEEDQALYEECLKEALAETKKEFPLEEGQEKPVSVEVWAAGNIRIGELILIIDSDTIVPEDCFLDAASEMHWSPQCAIIQHASDVMFVTTEYFEKFIAFFTRLVNTSISWVVSNGDVGCFVGHNAFIRWSALQEIAQKQEDGRWQIWSESHVSEDFDCALRMLVAGYDVRWASYSNGGFKEGVSLTCDDEINRWQKYAFGVSELLFHPLKDWLRKGPFTDMAKFFFLHSNLPLHYKFSSWAYLVSYYAISVAVPLSIAGYILYGLFIPTIDAAYMPSWQVNVALFVVFGCASAFAFAMLRYRSGQTNLANAMWEQAKWTPCNTIFFIGISFHVGLALISHLIGYSMEWGSTEKEAKQATVLTELPVIWKRYRITFGLCFLLIAMILTFRFLPNIEWYIIDWVAIVPLAIVIAGHFLYPFLLNPTIMTFQF